MKDFLQNKPLLTFAGGGVVFVLIYLLIFMFPTLNRISFLKTAIPAKEQELKQMGELSGEYLSIKKEYATKDNLPVESESIFSLVERIAKSKGLSEKISSMKPVLSSVKENDSEEVGVEVRMKDLTLQNLVSYLYTLESPPYNLKIKEIQINSPKDRLSLEVTFTASRWEKK